MNDRRWEAAWMSEGDDRPAGQEALDEARAAIDRVEEIAQISGRASCTGCSATSRARCPRA
jgi:hypothetical protein